MRAAVQGFMVRSNRLPEVAPRGERIAAWVDAHMKRTGQTLGELALRLDVDKRDLRRLLNEKSIGPRLNDALEAVFKHDFMDAVAAPLWGGQDRLTLLEQDIARERAKIAALDARLARETSARRARDAAVGGALRLLPSDDRRGLS